MTITALDHGTALVVIDLQLALTAQGTAHPIAEVVSNAALLAAEFRSRGLPVVLVRADLNRGPSGRADLGGGERPRVPEEMLALVPELARTDSDLIVLKTAWSAFSGTGLDETLRGLGVTQLVLAGIATSFGVESTARQAYDAGYSIAFATDAMTDVRRESHEHSVGGVFRILGQTGSTADVVAQLPA